MALIVIDGFDSYQGVPDLFSRVGALQWVELGGFEEPTILFVPGRTGAGQALAFAGGGLAAIDQDQTIAAGFNVNLTTGYLGFAVLPAGVAQLPSWDLQLLDWGSSLAQLTVRFNLFGGIITVYAGDPTTTAEPVILAQSGPGAFSPYIWSFIEIGATIGASGSFDLHVNGNSAVSGTGATIYPAPLPVSATSSTVFNGFRIRLNTRGAPNQASGTSSSFSIDDLYLCDSTTGPGTYPANGFLGDVSVLTLHPTANKSVTWTPLANTNWQEVGTATFEGDASYNSAVTVGDQDLFSFGSLPTNILAVLGVQMTGAYRKLNASAQTITQNLVSGGTAVSGAPRTLSLSYAYHTDLFTVDPNTSKSWSVAAVNSLAGGYTLAS